MHQSNNNGSPKKEWTGHQQLDNFPTLSARFMEVKKEEGRTCSGSLILFDAALNKSRHFSWQASYTAPQRWAVTGHDNAEIISDHFSHNQVVNFEIAALIQDRLNAMRNGGLIFRPQPKPVESSQAKPPVSAPSVSTAAAATGQPFSPPLSPPPAPEPVISAAPALPGAVEVAPPMLAVRIPVDRIRPNPEQPRRHFRKHALSELAKSMKLDGQRQLIEVVRVEGDPKADYELITGERRWRAAMIGGITHLNAIVKDQKEVPDKAKQHRLCFVADFHREGYTKLETALALMREKANGASVGELCKICGRSVVWVYQHLALNDLVPELKALLDPSLPKDQQLSFNIGCRVARAPKERQMEIYRQVSAVTGARLQLIEVNKLVAEIVSARPTGRPRKPADYVRNLRWLVPRAAADALTADGYPDKVFGSLVQYTDPAAVAAMLDQIDQAVRGFESLRRKIKEARKPLSAKPILELTSA